MTAATTRWILRAICDKCDASAGGVGTIDRYHAQQYLNYKLCQQCGATHHGMHPQFRVSKIKQIRNPKARWWNNKPEWIDEVTDG